MSSSSREVYSHYINGEKTIADLLMLPQCTYSWRSWTQTTVTQYYCDQYIFQKKFADPVYSFIDTSKTFYLIASFYLISSIYHLLEKFLHSHEKEAFVVNKWGTCIRNVFDFSQSTISSPNHA